MNPQFPHAIPFAWVATEEEALDLIVLHCAYSNRYKCYRVPQEWEDTDIRGAQEACRRRFGFPPL